MTRAMRGCEGRSSPPPRSRDEADPRRALPSVAVDIFGRNPGVAIVIPSDAPDPGKRQMGRSDKCALSCEQVERSPAYGARLVRDDVVDNGHAGARKLDGAHVQGVSDEDDGIRAAAHSEESGSRRMAGMYRRGNARQDFLAVLESLQPPSFEIRPKRGLCL